ncbi:MAG: septum site-determining protein MinC [SAR324 cluster bacterium]|nr:septum site-determining protein MinC [SAR324 cluster bacterium]
MLKQRYTHCTLKDENRNSQGQANDMNISGAERSVEIKGFGGALGLVLDKAAPFEVIESDLRQLLQDTSSRRFFQGSEIVLGPDTRTLSAEEFSKLNQILQEGELELKPLETNGNAARLRKLRATESRGSKADTPTPKADTKPILEEAESEVVPESAAASPQLALPTLETVVPPAENPTPVNQEKSELHPGLNTDSGLIVRQTLRSGQTIKSKHSVIVFGDLNAGAEIESEGDIIVLGTIRGMVHAGTSGDATVTILGLRMQPTQIRIGSYISQPPAEKSGSIVTGPERAFVENGQIVIESQACGPAELIAMLLTFQRRGARSKVASRGSVPAIAVGAIRL